MINKLLVLEFRNLEQINIDFSKTNFFCGENASGKTSIMEAIYLLKNQKSFRAKNLDQIIKKNQLFFGIKLEGNHIKIVLEKYRNTPLKLKLNNLLSSGEEVGNKMYQIGFLSEHDENLIIGEKEIRRNFINEIMFHVEHDYKMLYKTYQKALESRNHLLKMRKISDDDFWIDRLSDNGEKITEFRNIVMDKYLGKVVENLRNTSLEGVIASFEGGYEGSLRDVLVANKEADYCKKTTTKGPHKCDLSFMIDGESSQYLLSRGQIKLLNMILILSRIEFMAKKDEWVLLLIDDYFAEMDKACLAYFKNWIGRVDVMGINMQCFINAVSKEDFARMNFLDFKDYRVFEINSGKIEQCLI